MTELITRLDSDVFAERNRAYARLAQLGEPVVPALRKALAQPLSLEQTRRLRNLVDSLASRTLTGEELRSHRALEILELIATPDARRLLSDLAKGIDVVRFTQEAKDSLGRLKTP